MACGLQSLTFGEGFFQRMVKAALPRVIWNTPAGVFQITALLETLMEKHLFGLQSLTFGSGFIQGMAKVACPAAVRA